MGNVAAKVEAAAWIVPVGRRNTVGATSVAALMDLVGPDLPPSPGTWPLRPHTP